MYANIADSKKSIQTATISGTIGNVSFDGDNVIRGSFNVTNQCCDTSTFNYGGVYIGELTASFMGLNIPRNSWVGLEITPTVTIGEDDIPLGVYIINEVQHSGNKASVKAYDRMSRFDIAPSMTEGSNGTPYDILALACQVQWLSCRSRWRQRWQFSDQAVRGDLNSSVPAYPAYRRSRCF